MNNHNIVSHTTRTVNYPSAEPGAAFYEATERNQLAKDFKPGDIVFSRGEKPSRVARWQKIAACIGLFKGGRKELSSWEHVAIVVKVDADKGHVYLAEAMEAAKNQLRVVDLLGRRPAKLSPHWYQLEAHHKRTFEVYRMKEESSDAHAAASIASRLAVDATNLPREKPVQQASSARNVFSWKHFFKALLIKAQNVGSQGQKRLFKKIFDENHQQVYSTGGQGPKKTFCARFVADCYQQAEVARVYREDSMLSKLSLPKAEDNTTKAVSNWAKDMAKTHGAHLTSLVKTWKLDPKHTTPQDLALFLETSDQFEKALIIVPPYLV